VDSMEEILFGSQRHLKDVELSFTFSDHSLSSDDDLLPIAVYNRQRRVNQTTHEETTDESIGANTCRSPQKQMTPEKSVDCNDRTTEKRLQYYSSCPVCHCFGPKSINHIKMCANKRSIDPKRVIQLLSKCPKIEHSVDSHRSRRYQSKTNKKSNKLSDNYVINFEAGKPLKLSMNRNLVSDKSKYELSSIDPTQRQTLLMSKINDRIINNNDMTANTCKPLLSENVLPKSWTLSLLDSQSDEYFVDGFHKYHQIIS
jgi:hypothetical protein